MNYNACHVEVWLLKNYIKNNISKGGIAMWFFLFKFLDFLVKTQ